MFDCIELSFQIYIRNIPFSDRSVEVRHIEWFEVSMENFLNVIPLKTTEWNRLRPFHLAICYTKEKQLK